MASSSLYTAVAQRASPADEKEQSIEDGRDSTEDSFLYSPARPSLSTEWKSVIVLLCTFLITSALLNVYLFSKQFFQMQNSPHESFTKFGRMNQQHSLYIPNQVLTERYYYSPSRAKRTYRICCSLRLHQHKSYAARCCLGRQRHETMGDAPRSRRRLYPRPRSASFNALALGCQQGSLHHGRRPRSPLRRKSHQIAHDSLPKKV